MRITIACLHLKRFLPGARACATLLLQPQDVMFTAERQLILPMPVPLLRLINHDKRPKNPLGPGALALHLLHPAGSLPHTPTPMAPLRYLLRARAAEEQVTMVTSDVTISKVGNVTPKSIRIP